MVDPSRGTLQLIVQKMFGEERQDPSAPIFTPIHRANTY